MQSYPEISVNDLAWLFTPAEPAPAEPAPAEPAPAEPAPAEPAPAEPAPAEPRSPKRRYRLPHMQDRPVATVIESDRNMFYRSLAYLGPDKTQDAIVTLTDDKVTIETASGKMYTLKDCVTLNNGRITVPMAAVQNAILYGSAPGDLFFGINNGSLSFVSTLRSYDIPAVG